MSDGEQRPAGGGLGECLQIFRPSRVNIVAGFIIIGLLVAGGLAATGSALRAAYLAGWNLPATAEKGWSWFAVGGLCVIGMALLACAYALTEYVKYLRSRRVEVHANGFRFCTGTSVEDILWAEVTSIRETIVYERPPILHWPAILLLPKSGSTSYTVFVVWGAEYRFDGDSINSIRRFGKLLREQSGRLAVRWETVEEVD